MQQLQIDFFCPSQVSEKVETWETVWGKLYKYLIEIPIPITEAPLEP